MYKCHIKLKDFVSRIKAHFANMRENKYHGTKALQETAEDTVRYLESIVKLYDNVAVQAVENYQATVAVDEVVENNELSEASEVAQIEEPKKPAQVEKKPAKKQKATKKEKPVVDEVPESAPAVSSDKKAELPEETRYRKKGRNAETERFSYEWFVNKTDMNIISVPAAAATRGEVVNEGRNNAVKYGGITEDGKPFVRVADTGKNVIISEKALRHGLDRRFKSIAPTTMRIGEILHNSILVNEGAAKMDSAESSYVLIGAARNSYGELYIVRSVVNRFSNEVMSVDALYAVNTKKEPAGRLATPQGVAANSVIPSGSTITIAELLDYVNANFADVLPESVLRHYGHDHRPEGEVGEAMYYRRRRDDDFTDRDLLEMAANQMETDSDSATIKLTAREKGMLKDFKNTLTKLRELQAQRAEQGSIWYYHHFGDGNDRAAETAARNRMGVLDEMIEQKENSLLRIGETDLLKAILCRSRSILEKREKEAAKKNLRQYRADREESAGRNKYIKQIEKIGMS